LSGQHNIEIGSQEEPSRQQERAERILDAASELIQRWGYRKTTVDDIARHAGVAKGTIYLHWKTREELFLALLTREYLTVLEDFRQYLVNHPEGATLLGLAKQAMLLAMTRPLIKAMMLGDTEMLGDLARREMSDPISVTQRKLVMGRKYIELLRSRGLVRTDISLETQIHMLVATVIGFLVAERFLPDEYRLPPEQSAEMLAETVHRALEPDESVSSEQLQEVQSIFVRLTDQLIVAVKEQRLMGERLGA
jgi:AcrR family transcriptional regulator